MGKYLDYNGLSYLWDKIKLYLSSALSTKVDKIPSTDNAAVRFNGKQGAILNSGVIIDDNNNVTAAKFITSGGTPAKFVKGDGSLDNNSYSRTSDTVTSLSVSGNNVVWTKNGFDNNLTVPYATEASRLSILGSKQYTNVIGTANNDTGAVFYFMSVKPNNWNEPCIIKYKVSASIDNIPSGILYSIMTLTFCKDVFLTYNVDNYIGNTSYRAFCYHYSYSPTENGFNNNYGHLIGIGLNSSYLPINATYVRTFNIEVIEATNCTFTLFDTMIKYEDVSGANDTNYNKKTNYNGSTLGNTHTGDANDMAYTARLRNPNIKAGPNKIFPYTIVMLLPDGRWESIVTSSSSGVSKSVNTHGFLLGHILLMYYNITFNENENITSTYFYSFYSSTFDHRYSFNTANNATYGTIGYEPVYLVGSIGSDGLFYLDSTKWWTQTLPNTEDGKLYIYLGNAYDYYRLIFNQDNPIYIYSNGGIRLYGGTSDNISWNNVTNKPTLDNIPDGITRKFSDYLTKFPIQTVSNTSSIIAEINKYYNITGSIDTFSITLPVPIDTYNLSSIILFFTTGTTPAITITSTANVLYQDGYAIEALKTYEVNCLFNGTKWIISSTIINTN